MVVGYVVSDLRNGSYKISAIFSGANTRERAERWAGEDSIVTQIRSEKRLLAFQTGKALPKRYWK